MADYTPSKIAVKEIKKSEQQLLFGKSEDFTHDHENEWQGMPEFVQENLEPYKSITIHFSCEEDIQSFSMLIKQKITCNTKRFWFPKLVPAEFSNKRYIDEENKNEMLNM